MKVDAHPYAQLFPLLREPELLVLMSDIREHGLRERITMFDGKILDGRNRYRAMERLDKEFSPSTAPKMFVEFDGDDPLEWVVSKNLHRRHLNESQRAVIAVKMADLAPKKNQYTPGLPIAHAARTMNVAVRTVMRAKSLMKREPEAICRVENGERRVGEEPNRKTISVVLTDAEHTRCQVAANRLGIPLCTWMRDVLLKHLDAEPASLALVLAHRDSLAG